MSSNPYLSATVAFALWGGWAFFVNSAPSNYSGVIAGLTQGSASFIITLLMVHSVQFFNGLFRQHFVKLLAPALITVACTGSGLVIVHKLASTPNIFTTIAPALTVAFVFCIFTSYQLSPTKQHEQQEQ